MWSAELHHNALHAAHVGHCDVTGGASCIPLVGSGIGLFTLSRLGTAPLLGQPASMPPTFGAGGRCGAKRRKGATRARAGELVAIPGSMETGSYICEGLGEPQSLMSSSHGAGRAMSRTAARKLRTYRQVQDDMKAAGILIASPNLGGIGDEGGHGYKVIEDVMSQQTDLLASIHKLRPLGVLKG